MEGRKRLRARNHVVGTGIFPHGAPLPRKASRHAGFSGAASVHYARFAVRGAHARSCSCRGLTPGRRCKGVPAAARTCRAGRRISQALIAAGIRVPRPRETAVPWPGCKAAGPTGWRSKSSRRAISRRGRRGRTSAKTAPGANASAETATAMETAAVVKPTPATVNSGPATAMKTAAPAAVKASTSAPMSPATVLGEQRHR